MRVVESPEDFSAALLSCQREASASFGDERVLIERYLQNRDILKFKSLPILKAIAFIYLKEIVPFSVDIKR